MTEAWLAVLQFADGLFPAGGFAHSLGLETYAQDGLVRDRDGLEAFVVAHLEGSAGPADAVAVAVAVRLAAAGEVAEWIALDERLEAMKSVPESREASRQMGRQTLRVAAALGGDGVMVELARAVGRGAGARAPRHGVRRRARARGRRSRDRRRGLPALDGGAAGRCRPAADRARPVRWPAGAGGGAAPPCAAGHGGGGGDAGRHVVFNPGLELAGLRHATLDSRLFRS